jgi:hypothetical protein
MLRFSNIQSWESIIAVLEQSTIISTLSRAPQIRNVRETPSSLTLLELVETARGVRCKVCPERR